MVSFYILIMGNAGGGTSVLLSNWCSNKNILEIILDRCLLIVFNRPHERNPNPTRTVPSRRTRLRWRTPILRMARLRRGEARLRERRKALRLGKRRMVSNVVLVCTTCHTRTSQDHRDAVLWEQIGGHLLCPRCSYKLDEATRQHPSNWTRKVSGNT